MELSVALDKELHGIIGEASGNRLIMVIFRALAETVDSFIDDMHQMCIRDRRSPIRCSAARTTRVP